MNAPRTQPDSDWLDSLLKEDARTYIEDAGFTGQVMQALPAQRPMKQRLRRWVPAMAAAAGGVVALCVLPGADLFLDGVADLMVADFTSAHAVALLGTLAVFVGIATALATDR
jgi:Domain of unknown function (DUF5056)